MKKYFHLTTLLLYLAFVSPLSFAANNISQHPGSMNFDNIDILRDQQPTIEITLRGAVLALLTALPSHFADDDVDATALNLLQVIEQVIVRSYSIEDSLADDVITFIEQTGAELETQSWVRVVRMREDEDSQVDIHVKMSEDEESLSGIVIMAMESKRNDKEITLVNIAGNFNPADLAKLGNQLDIDYLGDIDL